MTTDESPPQVYGYGRAVLWFVLATMVASILYSLWKVIANWTFITV